MAQTKIGIVGSGVIAETHAEAIANNPNLTITAVADVSGPSAAAFAKKWGANNVYASAEALSESGTVDAVHITTPPDSHAALAAQFLNAGIPTFVEKPVGTSADDLALLEKAFGQSKAQLGVNQNSLFHPAFEKLVSTVKSGEIGTIQSIQCHYAAPLRQLESGQFGHWMFAKPINILLEQAVHPLAQIQYLLGAFTEVQTMVGAPMEIADGTLLFPTTLMNLAASNNSGAQLHYSVGATYPLWTLRALCSDGVAIADMISNRMVVDGRSKWLEASDQFITGRKNAKQTAKQSKENFLDYAKSMIGVGTRCDSFYLGMAGSITNFYEGLAGTSPLRAGFPFAKGLVDACLQASATMAEAIPASIPANTHKKRPPREMVDAVILGGTGFIGRYVVEKCVKRGMTVRVVARNLRNLPAIFSHDNIDLVSADMRSPGAALSAIKGAKKVINLAHGGGGADAEAILKAMLGSAEAVFTACKEAGVERLVHIGSIAGLYLGNKSDTITGDTPPDPQPEKRADYARAKAYTDLRMLELGKGGGPEVVILRPGIVVGKGTPAAHSGLGVFNNDQHCLGWSDGTVALPFVLACDVADATIAAMQTKGIGGKCYNLCGDVTWTALEYFDALRKATGRPFTYHAQSPRYITIIENVKVLIKKIAGKKQSLHSIRDFKSRAMFARFDCSDAKTALGWTPISNPEDFYNQAIKIHARSSNES